MSKKLRSKKKEQAFLSMPIKDWRTLKKGDYYVWVSDSASYDIKKIKKRAINSNVHFEIGKVTQSDQAGVFVTDLAAPSGAIGLQKNYTGCFTYSGWYLVSQQVAFNYIKKYQHLLEVRSDYETI